MISKDSPTYIQWLLVNSDEAVRRAIVAIYRRQTVDEQETKRTRHQNARGFSAYHARQGSKIAVQIIAGKDLSHSELLAARIMMLKYVNQLCEVARERMVA